MTTKPSARGAVLPILISLSFCHLLNDLMQSLIPALYPMMKDQYHLDFTQVGLITLAFQLTPRCCSRPSGSIPTSVRSLIRWLRAWGQR